MLTLLLLRTWIQVVVESTLIFFKGEHVTSQTGQSHVVLHGLLLYMLKNLWNDKNLKNYYFYFFSILLKKKDKKEHSKTPSLDGGLCFHLSLDLLSFDDVIATSDNLSHPTASRPKMPGRRLPARFSGCISVSISVRFFQMWTKN